MGYQATAPHTGRGRSMQVSTVQDGRQTGYVRETESVEVVIACCSDEEYAERTAKPDEVKGCYVPGYLVA